MTANIINQMPYLRTSRNFPQEMQALSVEVNKSYIDIANAVNLRTIGIYATSPSITGESWFAAGSQRQQTLRQVFNFTSAGNIPHNIDVANIAGFTHIYGTFTNGTVWYPLPYTDTAAVANQVSVAVTSTNIAIVAGGTSPPIVRGYVVLEWLAQI